MAKPTDRFAIESIQKESFLPNYYQQMKIDRKSHCRGYHSIVNCLEGSVVLEDALADVVSGTEDLPIPSDSELSMNMNMYTIPKEFEKVQSQGFPLIEDLSSQYLRTHFNLCPANALDGQNDGNSPKSGKKSKDKKPDLTEQEKLLKSSLSSGNNTNNNNNISNPPGTSISQLTNMYNNPNCHSNISEHCSPTIHYTGNDPKFGPICISLFKFLLYSKLTTDYHSAYRVCVRTVDHDQTLRCTVFESVIPSPENEKESEKNSKSDSSFLSIGSYKHNNNHSNNLTDDLISSKAIINFVCPELDIREFKQVQQPKNNDQDHKDNSVNLNSNNPLSHKKLSDPLTEILKLDELRSCSRNDQKKRKIGILLQLPGQSTEKDMYNNQCGTENFRIFLDWLGKRTKLKGFPGYNGGLDCKRDQTGKESYYTKFKNYEIMFHVSTLLPFSEGNDSSSSQQLARKRHIGNDIITIIFQDEPKEGGSCYSADSSVIDV